MTAMLLALALQDGVDLPERGGQRLGASYRISYFPDQPVRGQATDLAFVEHEVSIGVPLDDEWSISAKSRIQDFDTRAALPLQPFPGELYDVSAGFGFRHISGDREIVGFRASFGSASDKPFHSGDEITGEVSGFLVLPSGDRDAWILSLHWSNNREFANTIPLPGVAYLWRPSDEFRLLVGFPFIAIEAKPADDVTVRLTWAAIRTIHFSTVWKAFGAVQFLVGFDWSGQRYLLARRADADDRLFYNEKRFSAGIRVEPCEHAFIELTGGYVFDRFWFVGRSLKDDDVSLDVGDGGFVALRIGFRK